MSSIRSLRPDALCVLAAVLVSLSTAAFAQSDASLQMLLGNPSGATTDVNNPNNYLMTARPQLALAYSNSARIPIWVSWHLAPPDLGSSGRSPSFYTDTSLPSGWYRVTDSDYSGSGYDRGHNCPSGDRTATDADNKAVFYMTNIMPQQADNNQGPWESLESFCRSQVTSSGNECYIITCWSGSSGTIAGGLITVPSHIYKIIVIIPNASGDDLARIDANTTVIAVDMPNVSGIRSNPWTQYVTSVYYIESQTGYSFFTALSPSIQAALKSKIYGSSTTATPVTTITPTSAPTANMVISQVYGGGGNTGAQYKNDFVEIFNRGAATQSLSGWSVQYASSSGTTWAVQNLTGSVAAGKYYLIQLGPTGSTGASLPTPDCVGSTSINLSGTSGKVALVASTTALSGSCPSSSSYKDFVGYGSANCYEGTSAAPTLSNTTAGFRSSGGCTDTNVNGSDFSAGTPSPRNSSSAANYCSGVPTATSTPAPTASATAAPTASLTAAPTATPSPTPSKTPTPTPSKTPTPTPSLTSSPSPTPSLTPSPTPTPVMVISQIYGGGGNTGAQYKNDFIEIFNRGKASQSLSGWSIQYASASGTTWLVQNLTGTVAAGKYYLIQLGPTGSTGASLPTPDCVGSTSINLSGTSGKVALVPSTTALSSSCPSSSSYKDFVGYGTANCYEGSGAAPTLSNTTAAFRASGGCTDTNVNSANFSAAAPSPRNSSTAANNCP